jgi:PAS domain S-box-containing protein
VSWVVQPWTDAAGAVGGVIIASEDVSEQRRTVQALQEAQAALRHACSRAPRWRWWWGRWTTSRFVQVNGAFEALSGYVARRGARPRQRRVRALWSTQHRHAPSAYRQLVKPAHCRPPRQRVRRRSGETIDVSFSSCRVLIAGRPHFVAMVVDITLQEQARRALEHQQEGWKRWWPRAPPTWRPPTPRCRTRRGHRRPLRQRTLRLPLADARRHRVAVNATELAMLGYTREEIVGQPISRFMSRGQPGAVFAERYAAFKARWPHARPTSTSCARTAACCRCW